ncbi:MAG: bifunctional diaminohydroxyphosphoribosylaminopyrimidine deaminase/5-amino-6-(5-phosphoribosylamino)uracil reductase RibD, partial [Novosphingobium sp.]|nr:bifunctional diaminohydroxyphosphoribosylaminopyrimidine deaminase/5-amino-6-(5-phosphoribosylamino)uracil reductase RibD [Novosphingobium sp.]
MAAAARLAGRGVPLSRPNPAVGALIVRQGKVVAGGWTQPGGRPHAEAVALAAAGQAAQGATLYVTLEPCAHQSQRGPACADLVAASGLARVVIGCGDPDPRTAGQGIARIQAAGIAFDLIDSGECAASLSGYLTRAHKGRPEVTLKLALSEDARLAPPPAEGQWLTGETARAHVHAWRAKMDAIVVGSGTLRADQPRLDVRLPGIEHRSPERWLLTHGAAPPGWHALPTPQAIAD